MELLWSTSGYIHHSGLGFYVHAVRTTLEMLAHPRIQEVFEFQLPLLSRDARASELFRYSLPSRTRRSRLMTVGLTSREQQASWLLVQDRPWPLL